MEYQEKILLVVAVLLVGLAIYFAFSSPFTKPQSNVTVSGGDTREAKDLLLNGISFGKGQTNYIYAYGENSDGYALSYRMEKKANESSIEVQNPLSFKKVYFLSNATLLCMQYPPEVNATCATVEGVSNLDNYLNSLRAEFFSEQIIENNRLNMQYLMQNGFLQMDPKVENKTIGGKACGAISYRLDFSNLSVSDAGRFGIGTNSPKVFDFSMCIDRTSGATYQKYFNYSFQGVTHSYDWKLVEFRSGAAGDIVAPANLVESGQVVYLLTNEKEQQANLAKCYVNNQGDERDKCIGAMAIDLHRRDLCILAGERADRCLVALVPLTKDATICPAIKSLSYRDDCYIELSGAFKNDSYCSSVQNASKMDFCRSVAMPKNATAEQNQSESGSNVDEQGLLNYIEQADSNRTTGNGTN